MVQVDAGHGGGDRHGTVKCEAAAAAITSHYRGKTRTQLQERQSWSVLTPPCAPVSRTLVESGVPSLEDVLIIQFFGVFARVMIALLEVVDHQHGLSQVVQLLPPTTPAGFPDDRYDIATRRTEQLIGTRVHWLVELDEFQPTLKHRATLLTDLAIDG
jgi:hypothetical protein